MVQKISDVGFASLSTTIITVEEQLRGRLDMVRRASSPMMRVAAYDRLNETIAFFSQIHPILSWSLSAETQLTVLKQQRVRVGAQDLRIASIVLAADGFLLTRNRRDFERVPNLKIADWS